MIKLTETQIAVLTQAAGREDGAVQPLPVRIKGGAATKIIHSLLKAGLITGMPSVITPAGRAAIAAEPKGNKPDVPAALNQLTVGRIAAAISSITGETVTAKSFNYKGKALERLAGLMAERNLTLRDVLKAAGIEAVTPEGKTISGLDIAPAPDPAKLKRKPRDSKQARLIAMLKRPKGASINEIVSAFGWQPHTSRGVIAGALKKKLGLIIVSEKIGDRRVYRIKE